jgi:glycosyltransferase involved in cell wall biosynthesis
VLFVLPWDLSAAGGVNQVVINLARETARRGRLRPIIFCADWSQEAFHTTEYEGMMLVTGRLRAPLAVEHRLRNLFAFAHGLRSELQAWRTFVGQHNIQVINPHYAGLNYFLFALLGSADRHKFRLIYSLHGADLSALRDDGPLTRAVARHMFGQADAIVSCSEDLGRKAQRLLALSEDKLHTIYNGIDVDELEHSRDNDFRPDIGDFDSYLVNVATFEHKKGQDTLLEAYTTLVRGGLKSALVLIGRSTPHLATLRSQARRLGLHGRVFFIPDLDHARTLATIRQADLLVQPSREEPFGITLLEAGYLGTPIVATRVGGIPEVLGVYYPYLVKPDNPAELAASIDEALFNPTETQRQIKLIKRQVSTRFTWGTAYSRYEALWSGSA